jgi:hypothetical protein
MPLPRYCAGLYSFGMSCTVFTRLPRFSFFSSHSTKLPSHCLALSDLLLAQRLESPLRSPSTRFDTPGRWYSCTSLTLRPGAMVPANEHAMSLVRGPKD